MFRGSKTPLKVKENEQKEEASFPLSRAQKSCKVTKSKAIRPSKKENFTDGNQTRSPKRALKCPKGPEENLCPPQGAAGGWQLPGGCSGALGGGVLLTEPPLPLHTREGLSSSPAVPLGNDFSTPERDTVEGEPDFGWSEQRKKPLDFGAVIGAECGIAQESFGTRPTGTSPTSLKFRRRSTIGLRGSPENNTLIRYLAQHRSSRQKETFTQISPFKPANVRSLKDKINTFQASFESLHEAEGEPGLSHLGEPSQEGGSSQNKAPFRKEPNLEQWSEKFMLGNRGAALKENLRENWTKSSRSELRICSILSPQRAGTVTEPAAAKEWVCEQQNPVKSLDPAVTGDTLETGLVSQLCACSEVARCEHSGTGDAVSALSRRKAGAVEGVSLAVQAGSTPSTDLCQSSSLLRSILKKTPAKELLDSTRADSVLAPRRSFQEYLNSVIDGGGDESAAVSNCVRASETLQTERSDSQSSKTPKKKKVTFGEVLSPEIFDQSLPANTPLRRGASPGCAQGQSPWARPGLSEEPLPLLDFGWDEEGVEPLPEFLEGSEAPAEAPSPVEIAEVAETDKPDVVTTRSSTKRKCRAVAQDPAGSSSGATNTDNDKDTKNPRSKIQRQKNPTTAAPKKTQRKTRPSYGKRRKKKVKKSLYGEREMASKKPLLSPIPEIPEVFSSVCSPNSPKADALFTEGAGLGDPKCRDTAQEPQAGRMRGKGLCAAALCPSPGLLEEAAATSPGPGDSEVPGSLEAAPEFSNSVPDAEGDFDTSDYFQQGKETPCEKEAKESSSLIEKEELEGNHLTGLEILEQQAVQEGAQRARCPQKDSGRRDPARRRSSSAFYFPPIENLEITGADLPVCSYNVEEVFSVPQAKEGSLQACRRRSRASAELRVRRSMRLSKDAASKGLAWIQLPSEIPREPKARRSSSTSILAGSENIHHREHNPLPFPAPGKENEGSAPLAAGPGRRWRRRSFCEATAQEMPWAATQRRRSTNSVCGKNRSDQKHSEAAETLELRLKDVSGISDFLK
ncbi:cell division cycle-associated protein 2 isoform X2 [Camarhynchus parvulus]|uniref:cell division cycle-associated protein 2 isoform X2 n=1 Tax=Geospiza parvula TaxID=87175 RepID=UPI001237A189|nr:cell division cycle-associated protein 2 isoform X2 [Camarhynchus parvulus]